MKTLKRLFSATILFCFVFNTTLSDLATAQTFSTRAMSDNLAPASVFGDLKDIEHKDIGRIKIVSILELSAILKSTPISDDETFLQAMRKKISLESKEATIYHPAGIKIFLNETQSLGNGLFYAKCRIKDSGFSGSSRTYYIVFSPSDIINIHYPFEIYTEAEFGNASGKIKSTGRIEFRKSHNAADVVAINRWMRQENPLNSDAGQSIDQFIYERINSGASAEIKGRADELLGHDARFPERIRPPYLWSPKIIDGLKELLDPTLKKVGLSVEEALSGKNLVFICVHKGRNYPVMRESGMSMVVRAHSSNNAMYIFLPEDAFAQMFTGAIDYKVFLKANDIDWLVLNEINAIYGLPYNITEKGVDSGLKQLYSNDVFGKSLDAADSATLLARIKEDLRKNGGRQVDLDRNLRTRDYASGISLSAELVLANSGILNNRLKEDGYITLKDYKTGYSEIRASLNLPEFNSSAMDSFQMMIEMDVLEEINDPETKMPYEEARYRFTPSGAYDAALIRAMAYIVKADVHSPDDDTIMKVIATLIGNGRASSKVVFSVNDIVKAYLDLKRANMRPDLNLTELSDDPQAQMLFIVNGLILGGLLEIKAHNPTYRLTPKGIGVLDDISRGHTALWSDDPVMKTLAHSDYMRRIVGSGNSGVFVAANFGLGYRELKKDSDKDHLGLPDVPNYVDGIHRLLGRATDIGLIAVEYGVYLGVTEEGAAMVDQPKIKPSPDMADERPLKADTEAFTIVNMMRPFLEKGDRRDFDRVASDFNNLYTTSLGGKMFETVADRLAAAMAAEMFEFSLSNEFASKLKQEPRALLNARIKPTEALYAMQGMDHRLAMKAMALSMFDQKVIFTAGELADAEQFNLQVNPWLGRWHVAQNFPGLQVWLLKKKGMVADSIAGPITGFKQYKVTEKGKKVLAQLRAQLAASLLNRTEPSKAPEFVTIMPVDIENRQKAAVKAVTEAFGSTQELRETMAIYRLPVRLQSINWRGNRVKFFEKIKTVMRDMGIPLKMDIHGKPDITKIGGITTLRMALEKKLAEPVKPILIESPVVWKGKPNPKPSPDMADTAGENAFLPARLDLSSIETGMPRAKAILDFFNRLKVAGRINQAGQIQLGTNSVKGEDVKMQDMYTFLSTGAYAATIEYSPFPGKERNFIIGMLDNKTNTYNYVSAPMENVTDIALDGDSGPVVITFKAGTEVSVFSPSVRAQTKSIRQAASELNKPGALILLKDIGENIEAMMPLAREAGERVAPPNQRYTLIVDNNIYKGDEIDNDKKGYDLPLSGHIGSADRFDLKAVDTSSVKNILSNIDPSEVSRTIIQVSGEMSDADLGELQAKAPGIRVIRVDTTDFKTSLTESAARRDARFDLYAMMLLARRITPDDIAVGNSISRVLSFMIETRVQKGAIAAAGDYINALAKSDPESLVKIIRTNLSYVPASKWRTPKYEEVAATLISA